MTMKRLMAISIMLFVFMLTIMAGPAYSAKVHRVKPGESLYSIAGQYELTLNELAFYNSYLLNPNRVIEGQVLIIPEDGDKIPDVPEIIYSVSQGDTIYKISQKTFIPMNALISRNNLKDINYLNVGQVLLIPPKDYLNQDTKRLVPRKGPAGKHQLALTFDDGPDEIYTGQVLDVLKNHGIKATFFLIGQQCINYPDIVARINNEDHLLGSHSWSHPDLNKLTDEELQVEIKKTEILIKSITGREIAMIRPPYGNYTKENVSSLEEMGYKAINWSVDSLDWRDGDVDKILINALPDVNDGGILLFHSAGGAEKENIAATVAVLPEIIYTLESQGYSFVALDELLSISPYK